MKNIRSSVVIVIIILHLIFSTSIAYSIVNSTPKDTFEINHGNVLITGFGPFGPHKINPSQYISENLSGMMINNASIIGMTLPVNYSESADIIKDAIEEYEPILVISLGLAANYKSIEIEKIAWNLKRNEYNKWPYYKIEFIDPQGAFFRVSDLPCFRIVKNIQEEKISVRTSIYGGLYICNALQYNVLGYIKENNLNIMAGFIHVPLLKSQNPEGMNLDEMISAISIAIEESLNYICNQ